MSLIVFSDIHGNIYALEKALKLMERYKVDNFLFLGDMAGYYYYQNECISLLNELPHLVSIKGNHDDNFLRALNNTMNIQVLSENYGNSYNLLNTIVTKESKKYFDSMQDFEKNKLYVAYHGSPNNYLNEYIYPDNDDYCFKNIESPYLFLGHTHYNMKKKYKDTTIINPGSIGQPRDYNEPSFCIVDFASNKVETVRFKYNKDKLNEDILKYDRNNIYLSDILNRTKK